VQGKINYYIKRPPKGERGKGKRSSFAIYSSQVQSDGATQNCTLKLPAIDSINKRYQAEQLDFEEALKHLQKVVVNLYAKDGIRKAPSVFNNDNQKILEDYWREEYSHRNLADPDAAYCKLRQAISALGPVSLLAGTQSEIQGAVNKFKGNKQRMIVGKINALLEFVKRRHEIRLRKDRPQRPRVKYLNEEEFKQIVNHLQPEAFQLLCKVLFLTGMRLSEAYAVDAGKIKPNNKTVYVESQRDEDDIEKDPKWGSIRPVYLLEPAADLIRQWVKVRASLKVSRNALRKQLKKVCQKVFPGQDEKHCAFKELRHSYAILLLTKGVSMGLTAQSLGNSEGVCQRHYAGFQLNPDSIEAIDSIVSKKAEGLKKLVQD
jgi:integrase